MLTSATASDLTVGTHRPALGAAWIAWSFALCAGGIATLIAAQRVAAEPTLAELAAAANWTRAAAVACLAGLALGAGLCGRDLRREQQAARWQLAAFGFAAISAFAVGGIALARGPVSRLLLVGDDVLAATLLVAGIGTLLLCGATSWLGGANDEIWPAATRNDVESEGEPADEEEAGERSRIALLTFVFYLAISFALLLGFALVELALLPNTPS